MSFPRYSFIWPACTSCGFINFYFIFNCSKYIPWWLPWSAIFCDSLPLGSGGNCDLFLSSRIWQRWRDVIPVIMLCYIGLRLERDSPDSLSKPLARLWTACGEVHMARNYGGHNLIYKHFRKSSTGRLITLVVSISPGDKEGREWRRECSGMSFVLQLFLWTPCPRKDLHYLHTTPWTPENGLWGSKLMGNQWLCQAARIKSRSSNPR